MEQTSSLTPNPNLRVRCFYNIRRKKKELLEHSKLGHVLVLWKTKELKIIGSGYMNQRIQLPIHYGTLSLLFRKTETLSDHCRRPCFSKQENGKSPQQGSGYGIFQQCCLTFILYLSPSLPLSSLSLSLSLSLSFLLFFHSYFRIFFLSSNSV